MSDLNFFAAANSSEGFFSAFEDIYKPDGYRAYIIKGGPGTGKSSFMKQIKKYAEKSNIPYVLYPCSSDPQSLDGISLPSVKACVLDGTSPHILEPKYAGIKENILNFGEFWNEKALYEKREKITSLTDENKALHKKASYYLKALHPILNNSLNIAEGSLKKDSLERLCNRLAKKYLPKKSGKGSSQTVFLTGITPNGITSFPDTPLELCKTRIIIKDNIGACCNYIMKNLQNKALENGYNIIIAKNPFMPSSLIDHIIIPELSLCFLREYDYISFNCTDRRIHTERFTSGTLKAHKNTLKFNKKLEKELLNKAVEALKTAKNIHDKLEKEYISEMNFKKLDSFSNQFIKKLDII